MALCNDVAIVMKRLGFDGVGVTPAWFRKFAIVGKGPRLNGNVDGGNGAYSGC